MTPTQHAALMDAIEAGFAAIHARLDRMEERQKQIDQTLAEQQLEPAPPCGYPPKPAPEGMRWVYRGPGHYGSSELTPWLNGYTADYYDPSEQWNYEDKGQHQSYGPDFHYFTAEPV